MKVYLSGPMTGYPSENHAAFRDAASALRAAGHEVWSPADSDHYLPDTATSERAWTSALHRDIAQIAESEGIAILEGYSQSKGAMLEIHIAFALRLQHVLIPQRLSLPAQTESWAIGVKEVMGVSLRAMWRYTSDKTYGHHAQIGASEMKT